MPEFGWWITVYSKPPMDQLPLRTWHMPMVVRIIHLVSYHGVEPYPKNHGDPPILEVEPGLQRMLNKEVEVVGLTLELWYTHPVIDQINGLIILEVCPMYGEDVGKEETA